MTKVYYLAGPYTHKDRAIMDKRFEQLTLVSAVLYAAGVYTFSPITQSHWQAKMYNLPTNWEGWQEFDSEMVKRCDGLYVLAIPGWRDSVGVTAEIEVAREYDIPISIIIFDEDTQEFEIHSYHSVVGQMIKELEDKADEV